MTEFWILVASEVLIWVALLIIAKKSGHPYYWLALVPIANLWLTVDLADAPIWYLGLLVVSYIIPGAGLIIRMFCYMSLWMKISESTNKSQWWGCLIIVPIVNVAVAWYLAMYEPDTLRGV